jgi:hypothetical protein
MNVIKKVMIAIVCAFLLKGAITFGLHEIGIRTCRQRVSEQQVINARARLVRANIAYADDNGMIIKVQDDGQDNGHWPPPPDLPDPCPDPCPWYVCIFWVC